MTQYLWQDREHRNYVYPFGSRPECLALIQHPPQVVLDIGCGSGGVGSALRQRFPQAQLWGCEFNSSAAEHARQFFDCVVEQDVETVDFAAIGLKQPFDLICLFDVLEHLVNPWKLLHNILRIMAADAHVLVSLPNVSNIALLYDALHERWTYRSWGLLDFTHLRFFSDFEARKMFYQTGYRVLNHQLNFLGHGKQIYEAHQNAEFPIQLSLDDMSIKIQSREHLARMCADQNLYLITPHHNQLLNDEERSLASAHFPPTYAFGG